MMLSCIRLLMISCVVIALVDDILGVAQGPQRDQRAQRERAAARRQRRHRQDKAKLIRHYLKKNGRLEGMIRLIDGSESHLGNVEIYHMGKWGAICDDEWDSREASVVCRELGFPGLVKETHNSHFGLARNSFWMDNIYCSGGESNLTDCRFDGWGMNDCQDSEAAGVICQTGPVLHDLQIPTTPTTVPTTTTTTTIATTRTTTTSAPVIFANVGSAIRGGTTPRTTPRTTRPATVRTTTTTKAPTTTTRPTTTTTKTVATTTPMPTTTETSAKKLQRDMPPRQRIKDSLGPGVKIRLRGGRAKEEGRVEVKIGDSNWGLVCGDGWSLYEAAVVCRELGFGFGQHAIQTDFFGGNRTSIALSGVQCHGSERSLADCMHDRFGKVNCPGKKDNIAAVVCATEMADLVPDHLELARSAHLEDRQLFFLQCAMEENCLSSSAYQIQKDDPAGWHLETRRLLRFTARIANIGTADFRPFIPKHMWQWHACHMHYHSMEVFAHYDIIDSNGVKVAEGHKASFCLEDNQCADYQEPVYKCANYGDQGISVNCTDTYAYNIDCQWVDITDIDPGFYTFKVVINPDFKVAEQSFDNNAAVCKLYYTHQFASIYDCTLQRP